MKLAEFKDLCDREWGEARGDVQALRLTNDSLLEFTTDVLLAGAELQRIISLRKARALEAVRMLGAEQRRNADDLRTAIRKAKDAGVSWSEIGRALGMVRETVFRQYQAGSPIVVVKARQNPSHP